MRKVSEVKWNFTILYQGYVLSTWFMTVDIDSDHLAEVVFVWFFHCKVILSILFRFNFLEENHWALFTFKAWVTLLSYIFIVNAIRLSQIFPLYHFLPNPPNLSGILCIFVHVLQSCILCSLATVFPMPYFHIPITIL